MTWFGRVALVAAPVVVAGAALAFRNAQNRRGGLGGAISRAKLAWLGWCLATWFLVCPLMACEPGLAAPLRWVLGTFSVAMWARGVAELLMLYRWKNWRPPYGVAHDLACIALVGGQLAWNREALLSSGHPLDQAAFALALAVLVSLVLETVYAAWFFRLVGGRTTGDEGVWFADEHDPRYRRVNLVTAAFNVLLYAVTLAVVAAAALGVLDGTRTGAPR